MPVRVMACLVVVAALSGCAGPGAGVTGNDTGGIIPWTPDNHALAGDMTGGMAIAHCARYGKRAIPTGSDRRPGGYDSFSCVFDRHRAP